MKYYLILVNFFIVLVRPVEMQPENSDVTCNTPECQQSLQNRLETIEAAVRTIVTTLSSQTAEFLAPVKEIFAQDPAISSILSATPIIRSNFTTNSSSAMKNETTAPKGDSESLQQGKILVDNLKGLVKCSLAHFVDISTIDSESNSSVIAASFNTRNESLEINWPVLSAECFKLSSGVWIRIYQINSEVAKSPVETSLSVPQKCIKKNSRTTYSIALSSPSATRGKTDPCLFSLTKNLIQCRSYAVEIVPNFQTLRGKTLRTEIVIPPKLSGDSSTKSLMDIAVNSNSLKLKWKDNSGCAPQMTSLNLKVLQDGFASNEQINDTMSIPRSCLREDPNEVNTFSMALPINQQTCPIEWQPLDKCRKYTFNMSSQYTATWNGLSSSLDIFTKGNEDNFTIFSTVAYSPWRCPRKYFSCNNYCESSDANFVCNGNTNCAYGRDEHYCDQSVCHDGFKCGRQCIPKELVCNGQHDCLDGSDEYYGCIYANSCQHLTNSSGNFSSQTITRPSTRLDGYYNNEIHSERVFDATLKTAVLISVQSHQQIWLFFEKCVTMEKQHFVKIYDGPYSTSPVLLSTSGSVQPFSVRSSSNELYVEFPSYYEPSYGIQAFYTSINRTNKPFVTGCGGYLNGDGIISIPNNVANNSDFSDCFWFIEARNHEDTILLSSSAPLSSFQRIFITDENIEDTMVVDITTQRITTTMEDTTEFEITAQKKFTPAVLSYPRDLPSIIVYDGWSSSGVVLHDRKDSMKKSAIYSISNKMLVHYKPPTVVRENFAFSWTVSKISTLQCKQDFTGASGIIKSPNYPSQVYPNLVDCRWSITVKPKSKVRLLFAFFETQAEKDFLYVYDGPSVYSKLLFEQSGSVSTPFEVNSTTNQVLVRFVSDKETSYPGFLAVYSTV